MQKIKCKLGFHNAGAIGKGKFSNNFPFQPDDYTWTACRYCSKMTLYKLGTKHLVNGKPI